LRRQLLAVALSAPLWVGAGQRQGSSSQPALARQPRRPLTFPRDLGSHPDTAIEWWYVTGSLQAQGKLYGFQLTFFRSKVPTTQAMRSAFAAKQLIFAHAAVTDVAGKRLRHDQRIARSSGTGSVDLAAASQTDTDVNLHDWSLVRREGRYLARASGADFGFELNLAPTQDLLLQGDGGWSQKGPEPAQASYYYSLPQLAVSGLLTLAGQTMTVQGQAWLDHEWSQSLLHPNAVGWDWIGMNLSDGSALTAFRLRDKVGDTVWAGGSWRSKGAPLPQVFSPAQVIFQAERYWKSPHSGTTYPVQWSVEIVQTDSAAAMQGVVSQRFTVRALVDDQELDSRASTGAIYWEGLSELQDSQGRVVGRGYLEMTGYASPMKL